MQNKHNIKEILLHKYLPTFCVFICFLCGMAFAIEFNNYFKIKKEIMMTPSKSTSNSQLNWYELETTSEITVQNKSTAQHSIVFETTIFNGTTTSKESSTNQNTLTSSSERCSYVLNTKTKKIHKATCRYAINTKEENKQILSEEEFNHLEKEKYSYCKVCFKEKV